MYNIFNSSSVQVQNTTFGPTWRLPYLIVPGRLVKFGAHLDF
jgi:hypothetical protein